MIIINNDNDNDNDDIDKWRNINDNEVVMNNKDNDE